MPAGQANRLFHHLRQAALRDDHGQTDAQLLASFVERRDQAAFAALVRRHGSMVLGVCRRVLHHEQDAEDAFQATFLVLARKAGSLRARELVGNWLYGTAYRTALEARGLIARRQARERQVADMPDPHVDAAGWDDLRPLLDRELSRLPDKYRVPVVLCELEGRSRREVAGHLGIPEGTLSSRLAAARKILAGRLARYGLAVTGASLAVLLENNGASAWVPAALAQATARAAVVMMSGQAASAGVIPATAAALAEGVIKTMFLTKLKTATVVAFGVVTVSLGAAGLLYPARAGTGPGNQPVVAQRVTPADPDPQRTPGQGAGDRRPGQGQGLAPDDPRRKADDPKAVERQLRDQLERARRELEALRAEVDKQRDVAEAQRQAAEQAAQEARRQLERAREAEVAARRDAEKGQYANAVRQAEAARAQAAGQQGARESDPRARLHHQFEERRQALMDELKRLEEQEREAMSRVDAQARGELRQREAAQTGRQGAGPAGGDKLDRILERLDHIEQRLERLEGGRSPGERRRQ